MTFRGRVNVAAEEDLTDIWQVSKPTIQLQPTSTCDCFPVKLTIFFDMPDRGVIRNDLLVGLRMLVESKYLVFYRVVEKPVEVRRVIHGSRDLSKLFT